MKGSKKTKVVANIVVGEPDVKPTTPSHVTGIFEGNHPHPHADAHSTGIRPKEHAPIDPRMPKISPA